MRSAQSPKHRSMARDWFLRSILVPVDLQQICSTLYGILAKRMESLKVWTDVRDEMFVLYAVFCMRNT